MNYDLLIDLHKGNKRQGPGGDEQTIQALQLAGLASSSEPFKIADIGCGTGASTLTLAEHLNADITAVDLFQDFLDILNADAKKHGVADKITTLAGPMEELPFEEGSLDVIWAEGAIYNMGFAKGVEYFKRFLKPGGLLAASEITWLTKERPAEIQQHWDTEYPEIATASDKIKVLEEHGFVLKGYFPLPESSWIENYYTPLENAFDGFVARHDSDDTRVIVEAEKAEIALYKKHQNYYSYGFYIAEKA
ncbi:MAG: class I SAM-dependent methyltransferase [Rickettsiales bacterium]|nr:class I SAM-dependent methyltransferase [Rickettsiales bacterium]